MASDRKSVEFSEPQGPEMSTSPGREIMRRMRQRQSVAYEPGSEGKFVEKGEHVGKAIAVFTSGGDAQGEFLCNFLL